MTGVIETVIEATEPRVDQEWEERTGVRRDEQRPRDIATKWKVVTGGRHRTEGIAGRTNKGKDASAKRVRGLRLDEEADAARGSEPHVGQGKGGYGGQGTRTGKFSHAKEPKESEGTGSPK